MVAVGTYVDLDNPIAAAAAVGADAIQLQLSDPQKWAAPKSSHPGGFAGLGAELADAHLAVYVHAPYVINVASPNNRIRIPSRKLLNATLAAAGELGARGVIVHGGHVTADTPLSQGFDNWRKALESLTLAAPLLIENTAGGNHAMARRPEAIAQLWAALADFDVGFCFDTCHAFAGGMPITSSVSTVLDITGRIDLVHANDSQGAFNSGRDRHAPIGAGQIGSAELLAAIAAAQAPAVICETPVETVATDIALIRDAL